MAMRLEPDGRVALASWPGLGDFKGLFNGFRMPDAPLYLRVSTAELQQFERAK